MGVVGAIETGLRVMAGAAGLLGLLAAIVLMIRSARRPAGYANGPAAGLLRPSVLLLASLLFLLLGALLWRPIPVQPGPGGRLALAITGALLLWLAVALYFWGLHALGESFAPSSGFGVRLPVGQRLISQGPYRFLRHPMYLAVILAGLGSLLLYRTWAALVFAVMMLGLVRRARREEQALAQVFGAEWQSYARRVPAWVPRFGRKTPGAIE